MDSASYERQQLLNAAAVNSKCFWCATVDQLKAMLAYIYAVIAGGSTDPTVLAQASTCYQQCMTEDQMLAAQAYLMAVNRGESLEPEELVALNCGASCYTEYQAIVVEAYSASVTAGLSQDPATLLRQASRFLPLSENQLLSITTYLLAVIAGGTATGVAAGLPSNPVTKTDVAAIVFRSRKFLSLPRSEMAKMRSASTVLWVTTPPFDGTLCAVTGITDGGGDTFDCYTVGVVA